MLTIVPTPIGNLKDITLRAIETLQTVDAVICEDSRRTSFLLQHLQIHKSLLVLNDFNESRTYSQILERLRDGQHLALVSDAGTPLVSDPGYKLVRQALAEGLEVDSLPGPTAAITALTLSSLPPDKFIFLGYLPEKSSHRLKLLQSLPAIQEQLKATYIAYTAPHKLLTTLEDLGQIFGLEQEVVLAKELTKIYQKVEKKSVAQWLDQYKKAKPKGEYVLLFALNSDKPKLDFLRTALFSAQAICSVKPSASILGTTIPQQPCSTKKSKISGCKANRPRQIIGRRRACSWAKALCKKSTNNFQFKA